MVHLGVYMKVHYCSALLLLFTICMQYGKTPLDYARLQGHHDVVDYLVTLGKFVMLINVYSS